jgi:hypothetical protein
MANKWRVSLHSWDVVVDAEDEGYALMQADNCFSFMSEARAEEITQKEASEVEK